MIGPGVQIGRDCLISPGVTVGFALVGDRVKLLAGARIGEANWLAEVDRRPVLAKVRSMAKPVPAQMDGDRLLFAAPEYGVAPGQAAVLYDAAEPTRVLGGGWIEESFAAEPTE